MDQVLTVSDPTWVRELWSRRKKGWSLPQEFYTSEQLFQLELERIFKRHWLHVGHSCEIREPGDFITFEIGNDSVIVMRQDDGQLKAFFNTCRHRGSRLLNERRGRAKSILCPYHQWNYSKSGKLQGCGGIEGEIEKENFPLHEAHIKDVAGFLYVSLAPEGAVPDFSMAAEDIARQLRPHRLERAKVAHEETYEVKANWKLVWENNRECYHCRVGHPEYIRSNYDATLPDDMIANQEVARILERVLPKWQKHGLDAQFRHAGVPFFPSPGKYWRSLRSVLRDGWFTQSADGALVSRLMGEFTDPEMGSLRVSTLPNLWNHSNCDYSASTRLFPLSPLRTRVTVTWLVHEDAKEGEDYDIEKLIFIWKRTGEQDWQLCETNQLGVLSSRYAPGPYSSRREYNVDAFVDWYEQSMRESVEEKRGAYAH